MVDGAYYVEPVGGGAPAYVSSADLDVFPPEPDRWVAGDIVYVTGDTGDAGDLGAHDFDRGTALTVHTRCSGRCGEVEPHYLCWQEGGVMRYVYARDLSDVPAVALEPAPEPVARGAIVLVVADGTARTRHRLPVGSLAAVEYDTGEDVFVNGRRADGRPLKQFLSRDSFKVVQA